MNNNKLVHTDAIAAIRGPITAVHARPPSSLAIGSKFSEDTIVPDKPTRKRGSIGMGCDNGISITFGASTVSNDPARKLVRSVAAGMEGKLRSLVRSAFTVFRIPITMQATEKSQPETGPLSA